MSSRRSMMACNFARLDSMKMLAGGAFLQSIRLGIARRLRIGRARRREIDVVLVRRLDRWGRPVTDLLPTLQELEHLGLGFVSLPEALDLTTPAGRAMAGLLAIFAEFEREILREPTRAGLGAGPAEWKRLTGQKRRRGMPLISESYIGPVSASSRPCDF